MEEHHFAMKDYFNFGSSIIVVAEQAYSTDHLAVELFHQQVLMIITNYPFPWQFHRQV